MEERKRQAELLRAFWKQAPVAVLEKAECSMLGMQPALLGAQVHG